MDDATTEPTRPSLAEQVRAARGERTQAEVARAAGIAQQRVAEVEAGREPMPSTLKRLAAALGCVFTIGPETDVGHSRPKRASDRASSR